MYDISEDKYMDIKARVTQNTKVIIIFNIIDTYPELAKNKY